MAISVTLLDSSILDILKGRWTLHEQAHILAMVAYIIKVAG